MRPSLVAIFLFALYFTSCRKEEVGTGIGLYNQENNLGAHYVDTFSVVSYSKVEDSVNSSNYGIVNLGVYNDPFFGYTKASFYTQFEIGGSGVNFGDTLNCDSIVLYLKLGSGDLSYYGVENNPLNFDVHLISKSAEFTSDQSFYTSSSLPISHESLLDPDFNSLIQPSFMDTVFISRDSSFNALKITGVLALKLKKEFGQQLLDQNGTDVFASNVNFLEQYKGLYVSIQGNEGSDILYIDMSNFGTTMMLYYKEGAEQENKEYKFIIDDLSAHFNKYEHDYDQSGSIRLIAQQQDSTLGNQYFYNQSGGGFVSYISFPTILNLLDSQLFVPVNRAELIIPVEPGTTKEYAPPAQMFIFRINDEGNEELIADQYANHVDGQYDEANHQYRFNIVKHIQDVLNGNINPNGLVIKTNNPGTSPNRVLLNGSQADTSILKPMKLRLYYSSFIN